MSEIRYVEHKDFRQNIQKMTKAGGSNQKAAHMVQAMFYRISMKEDPFTGFQVTNHGETRIEKCVKYDLSGRSRLITVQDNKIVFLLFFGNHEDSDKWLDRHKDVKFSVDSSDEVNLVPTSTSKGDRITFNQPHSYHTEHLYTLITPQSLFDRLVESVPRNICRKIETISGGHSEQEIFKIVSEVENEETSKALYDTLVLIRSDNTQDAHNRIKLYLGDDRPIEDLSAEEIRKVKFGDAFIEFRPDDKEFLARADQLMKGGDYKNWMLFMHPEQEKIATANLTGPGKLIGVSGSGKTCVVVRRSIWLANQYPDDKILVLTLNKPLASLIENLVKSAAPESLLNRIEVKPFFTLCQNLLLKYEPENTKTYDDKTWKSGEHIDEIWTEFYRCELNNNDAEILLPIHISLIQRGINSEHYIKEEFDWIRSAYSVDRRDEYLKVEREGRVVPFDIESRKIILRGLECWEKKMRDIGICDYLGLATELYKHLKKFEPQYRSIIVDECQDFGTIELEIIRALSPQNTNDIFLCGDPAQKVKTKKQSMRLAGIECGTRSLTLRKNYRNTKDILSAAFQILKKHYRTEHQLVEDYEFLDPELADRSGTTPLLLTTDSLGSEFSCAVLYLQNEILANPGTKGCIAYCGYSNYEVETLSNRTGIPLLDGAINIDSSDIFLSDLEQTKGFEFDYMVILNCSSSALPDQTAPKEEQFRDISKFYVAMTRTKQQLILSYSGDISELLENSDDFFIQDNWSSWLEETNNENNYEPIRLELNRGEGNANSLALAGTKFIYHNDAIGLTARSIEVLINYVDGVGLRDKRGAKKWKSVGQLLSDMGADRRVKNILGPVAFEDISKSKFAQRSLALKRAVESQLSKLSWKKTDSSETA